MTQATGAERPDTPTWEREIRTHEEEARVADQVLDLLHAGRIRHGTYECEIEHLSRHGDVVVVMGHDRVTDAPDGNVARRRYTNVWQLQDGRWRSIARHAQLVSRGATG